MKSWGKSFVLSWDDLRRNWGSHSNRFWKIKRYWLRYVDFCMEVFSVRAWIANFPPMINFILLQHHWFILALWETHKIWRNRFSCLILEFNVADRCLPTMKLALRLRDNPFSLWHKGLRIRDCLKRLIEECSFCNRSPWVPLIGKPIFLFDAFDSKLPFSCWPILVWVVLLTFDLGNFRSWLISTIRPISGNPQLFAFRHFKYNPWLDVLFYFPSVLEQHNNFNLTLNI